MLHFPPLDKPALAQLQKLKVSDILDFIIHYLPKSYTDTTPSTTLTPHTNAVLRVEIAVSR